MTALPEIPKAVDSLEASLRGRGTDQLIYVCGQPGSGKTTVLAQLAARLRQHAPSIRPIHVCPPGRSLDSGAIALGQLAMGLKGLKHASSSVNGLSCVKEPILQALEKGFKPAGAVNGQMDALLLEPAPWSRKLAAIADALERHAPQLVLLVDGADGWKPPVVEENQPFLQRVDDVVSLLRDRLRCRRVFATRYGAHVGALGNPVALPTFVEAEAILRNGERWGDLAQTAEQLWADLGDELNRCPILSLRLLVAYAAVSSVDQAAACPRTPGGLARALAGKLQEDDQMAPLCDAWSRISLLRTRFGDKLLDRICQGELTPFASSILRQCLLSRTGEGWELHETLRDQPRRQRDEGQPARPWLSAQDREDWHGKFAIYHRDRFRKAQNRGQSLAATLRDEMEAFYHSSMSHDPGSINEYRTFFSDQLNMLGKFLSKEARDYQSATVVFGRSLQWDQNDDYAHHYLAWNLDLLGRARDRVERHYRKAIDLAPDRVWWWSRWICFLITLGRTREAEQQWNRAQDALDLLAAELDVSVYFHLHSWIARLLLHRGQLAFAATLLNAIPDDVISSVDAQILRLLKHHLQVLLDVQRQEAVFPPSIERERQWQGPHINSRRNHAKRQLTAWVPARVERIEPNIVHLFAAYVSANGNGAPEFGEMDIDREEFDRWSLDQKSNELESGQFVEVGFYGERREDAVIRVHHESQLTALPPVFPDPVRFLRHERWVK